MTKEILNSFIVDLRVNYEVVISEEGWEVEDGDKGQGEKYATVYAALSALCELENHDPDWESFIAEALNEVINHNCGACLPSNMSV